MAKIAECLKFINIFAYIHVHSCIYMKINNSLKVYCAKGSFMFTCSKIINENKKIQILYGLIILMF